MVRKRTWITTIMLRGGGTKWDSAGINVDYNHYRARVGVCVAGWGHLNGIVRKRMWIATIMCARACWGVCV